MVAVKNTKKLPKLCNHKASGRAYVTLCGRRIYLGTSGTAEAEKAYARAIQEWLANGKRLPTPENEVTLVELSAAYLDHCSNYYRDADGNRTTSYSIVKLALRLPLSLYGEIPAAEFGPIKLKACLAAWIDGTADTGAVSRHTANRYRGQVVAMFRWAAGNELIQPSVWHGLQSVPGLKYGRTGARESKPVQPVEISVVEKTKKHLPGVLCDVIDLQLLTGARPTEILQLTPAMIDQTGEVWTADIVRHKTRYAGKARTLHLGPKAQAIVKKYLLRQKMQPLFSPKQALLERYAEAGQEAEKINSRVGDTYKVDAYRRAITRAVDKHNAKAKDNGEKSIAQWHPNQLRHTRATELRKQYGIDTAGVILGHSKIETTALYAEQDKKRALEVMQEIG